MIPKNFIIEWRQHAPWISDEQVEQDLIISRALVELFSSELIAKTRCYLIKHLGHRVEVPATLA